MDKSAYRKQSFEQANKDRDYWLTKSFAERLAASKGMTLVAYQCLDTGFLPFEKKLTKMVRRDV